METTQALTRTQWNLDPSHSQIGFKVKYLMVTNIRGVFNEYNGNIYTIGDDFTGAEIDVLIKTASISTGDAARDNHLKSLDFLDTENFREIQFRGIASERVNVYDYVLQGDLSIKGARRVFSSMSNLMVSQRIHGAGKGLVLSLQVKSVVKTSDLPGMPC